MEVKSGEIFFSVGGKESKEQPNRSLYYEVTIH
jgi:hypothetical protein